MLTRDITIILSRCTDKTIKLKCEGTEVRYINYVDRAERFWDLCRSEYIERIAESATSYILHKTIELHATTFNIIKDTVYNMVMAMHIVGDIDEMRATINLLMYGDDDLEKHD